MIIYQISRYGNVKNCRGLCRFLPIFQTSFGKDDPKKQSSVGKPMELSHIQETSPANFLPQNIPAMQQAQLTARLVGLDFSDFHFSSAVTASLKYPSCGLSRRSSTSTRNSRSLNSA